MDPIGQSIAGTLPSRLQAHTYLKSLNMVILDLEFRGRCILGLTA